MCQASREKGESLVRWGRMLWRRSRWRMWGQSPRQSSTESSRNTRRSFQARKDKTTGTRITAPQQVHTNRLGADPVSPSQARHQQYPDHPASEVLQAWTLGAHPLSASEESASHDSLPDSNTIAKRGFKKRKQITKDQECFYDFNQARWTTYWLCLFKQFHLNTPLLVCGKENTILEKQR